MLLVDTSSLLLISASLDLLISDKKIFAQVIDINSQESEFPKNLKKYEYKKNRFYWALILYLMIIFINTINIFIGFNNLENSYTNQKIIVNKQEEVRINQIKLNGENLEDISELNEKKNQFLNTLERDISKRKFSHFKESLRIIILCLIWFLGFYRLYKFACKY